MGGAHYFVLRQGWADIGNIAAFYHEKAPMFTLSAYNRYCTPTHPPSTSSIQFSVWHVWLHISGQAAATFQEKDLNFSPEFYW